MFRLRSKWTRVSRSFSNSSVTAECVLSESNKSNCIRLLKMQKPISGTRRTSQKEAAVLVPLCTVDGHPSLLYTVRAKHLKINGGEVAFPGGMRDVNDSSLQETALRETSEEIGAHPSSICVWGKGPDVFRPDIVISPFLAYIGEVNLNNFRINTDEVSMIFTETLSHLSSPENFATTKFRLSHTHVYKTPVYLSETKRIWGLTAVITNAILSALIPDTYNANIRYDSSFHKVMGKSKGKVEK